MIGIEGHKTGGCIHAREHVRVRGRIANIVREHLFIHIVPVSPNARKQMALYRGPNSKNTNCHKQQSPNSHFGTLAQEPP